MTFGLDKSMRLRQTITAFLVVLVTSFIVFAQSEPFSINKSPLPPPTGMVNDLANVIDDATEAQIEKKLRDFKNSSNPTTELAVVTIQTTGERPIFDYSLAVARGWGIGSKETSNPSGLLLIAINDRKAYVQISKDLEGDLPDGIVTSYQRQYLIPAFKQAQYGKGINDLMDAYIKRINDQRAGIVTATPTPTATKSSRSMPFGCYVLICFIVVFFILVIIFSRGGGGGKGGGSKRDRWQSGGFGGNTSNSSYTPPIIFWGGGGGSSSSSDWGSSSSGGDSWGGFGGGGDFGGGGGGSDW